MKLSGYPVQTPVVHLWAVADVQALEEDQVPHVVEGFVDEVGARGVDGLDVPSGLPRGGEESARFEHDLSADPTVVPVSELDAAVSRDEKSGRAKVGSQRQQALLVEPLAADQLLVF